MNEIYMNEIYSKIKNPYTNRWVDISSKLGNGILYKYINQVGGGNKSKKKKEEKAKRAAKKAATAATAAKKAKKTVKKEKKTTKKTKKGDDTVENNVVIDDVAVDNMEKDAHTCEQLLWDEDTKYRYSNKFKEEDKLKIKRGHMRNLNPIEFRSNRLNLVNCNTSKRVNCQGGKTKQCYTSGNVIKDNIKYMYAAVPNEFSQNIDIYIAEVDWETPGELGKVLNHSNILGDFEDDVIYGKPVCAGFIQFAHGKIIELDNSSGHYKPTFEALKCFAYFLYNKYPDCFNENAIISEGGRSVEGPRQPRASIYIRDLTDHY